MLIIKRVIFLLLLNTIYCDHKVLERYERQLNHLTKKLNNGKPVIVNGKIKRYKCVEEYVLLDEYGNVIADNTNILKNDNGKSNKDYYIEPKKKKSSLDASFLSPNLEPPSISTIPPLTTTKKKEYQTDIFPPTTFPPSLQKLDESIVDNPMAEKLLPKEGLNIRRLEPKTKSSLDRIKNIQPLKNDESLDKSPDSKLFQKYRQQSLRSSQSKYTNDMPSTFQKDYDDYQYYEMNPEYARHPNYHKFSNFYKNYDYDYIYPRRLRGESRHRLLRLRYDDNRRMRTNYSRNDEYEPMSKRRYSTNKYRKLLPIIDNQEYNTYLQTKNLNSNIIPSADSQRDYPTRTLTSTSFKQMNRHYLQPLPIDSSQELTTLSVPQMVNTPNPPSLSSDPSSQRNQNLQMNSDNCNKVVHFAKAFNVSDPEKWVRENCLFALTFAPGYTCDDIAKFVSSCKRHHFL